MNIFGFKARRNAGLPTLARPFTWVGDLTAPMAANATTTRYDDKVRAAYIDNAVAQRAARLVSESVASAPLLADDPATLVLPITAHGRAGRPLSPVQLVARWGDDGSLSIGWTARSRLGFDWPDGRDIPDDEPTIRWQLLLGAGAASAVIACAEATLALAAADIAAWRGHGPTLGITVIRIGDFGVSPPTALSIPL